MNLKFLISFILFIVISVNGIGQSSSRLELYKNIKDTTRFLEISISKEEFLKLDSLIIDPKDSSWFEYSIVLTGKGKELQFRHLNGRIIKIDSLTKEWVKQTEECVITIDDVQSLIKEGNKHYPSVNISVK